MAHLNYNERDIVLRIQQGDKDVFRIIYDIYYKRIQLYAISYVNDADIAEDIVQDLLFHLWEIRNDIQINTSLSSYLYKAIHNRCIAYLRHKKVIARYQERHLLKIKEAEILNQAYSDFSFDGIQANEIKEIQERILNFLPAKTKKIFQLSRNDDKNNKEIANAMNLSIKAVEYHITKALKTFQLALKDYILFLFLVTFNL